MTTHRWRVEAAGLDCSRPAFTVVELLVCVGVLAVLAGLILPAIQASRSSASRLACSDRLRQVTLASLSFTETAGHFPVSTDSRPPLILLGPYVEADGLDEDALDDRRSPPVYLCPADGQVSAANGEVSLRFNDGTGAVYAGYDGTAVPYRAKPTSPRLITLADVTDGLSQTALLSERLADGDGDDRRAVLPCRISGPAITPQLLRASCEEGVVGTVAEPETAGGLLQREGYSHGRLPNSHSCYEEQTRFGVGNGLVSATSLHPGGVNVAYADGRVVQTSDRIEADVWFAAGTRAAAD